MKRESTVEAVRTEERRGKGRGEGKGLGKKRRRRLEWTTAWCSDTVRNSKEALGGSTNSKRLEEGVTETAAIFEERTACRSRAPRDDEPTKPLGEENDLQHSIYLLSLPSSIVLT